MTLEDQRRMHEEFEVYIINERCMLKRYGERKTSSLIPVCTPIIVMRKLIEFYQSVCMGPGFMAACKT